MKPQQPRTDSLDSRDHARPQRVVMVGAGTRLLSAMSYYTIRVTNALAGRFDVIAIPMRQLLPTFLYPGRARVGATSTALSYDSAVTVLDGIDWYWGPRFVRVLRRIWRSRPDVVVFQWWTGTVLHTYLAIAVMARLAGASLIVEVHEVLDTGEERLAIARTWVRLLGRPFFRLASAFVIHSEYDRARVEERYGLHRRQCVVIPHGPNDHHAYDSARAVLPVCVQRDAPPDTTNLLFFGIIRPYKGLEDLVEAFNSLDADEVEAYWLTVVGETWEGWDLPCELIESSHYRERITLVNRFVSDDEVIAHFANADAVVLPYHRSSASSPASVTMSNGLPLIITAVGGLPSAVAEYNGAILVPPHDPKAIRDAIRRLPSLHGQRFANPHSWDHTVAGYAQLVANLKRLPAYGEASTRSAPHANL